MWTLWEQVVFWFLQARSLWRLQRLPRLQWDLPTRFTKTASGDNWLILNTVQDQNKELIIGFVSPAQLAIMKSSPTWYCDGTFDCVLAIEFVNQVWIIVADTPVGVSVPVAFFLTERRTEDTYQQILTTLRDKYGVTGPKTLLCDFEKVSRNFIVIIEA